jgi:hypothetical protein
MPVFVNWDAIEARAARNGESGSSDSTSETSDSDMEISAFPESLQNTIDAIVQLGDTILSLDMAHLLEYLQNGTLPDHPLIRDFDVLQLVSESGDTCTIHFPPVAGTSGPDDRAGEAPPNQVKVGSRFGGKNRSRLKRRKTRQRGFSYRKKNGEQGYILYRDAVKAVLDGRFDQRTLNFFKENLEEALEKGLIDKDGNPIERQRDEKEEDVGIDFMAYGGTRAIRNIKNAIELDTPAWEKNRRGYESHMPKAVLDFEQAIIRSNVKIAESLAAALSDPRQAEALLSNSSFVNVASFFKNIFSVFLDGNRVCYGTYVDGFIWLPRHKLTSSDLDKLVFKQLENTDRVILVGKPVLFPGYDAVAYRLNAVNGVDKKPIPLKKVLRQVKSMSPSSIGTIVGYLLADLKTTSTGSYVNASEYTCIDSSLNLTFTTPLLNTSASTPFGAGDCGLPLMDLRSGSIIGFHCYGPSESGAYPYNGAVPIKVLVDKMLDAKPLNGTSPASSQ